jgi:phytoene dehydrogenase-like protein
MSLFSMASRQTGMTDNNHDVIIVGGGVAGLTAAAYIARAGHTVEVLERSSHLGGRGSTSVRDGFHFNQGPHALYRGGAGEAVLQELGVQIRGGSPSVSGRIVFSGKDEIAPAGPGSLLRTKALGARAKAEIGKLLGTLPRLDAAAWAGRSAGVWVDASARQPRSRELLHALVRLSTYTNDPDRLSAQVAISQLQLALDKGVLYLDHGWQSLVDQLAATEGVSTRCGVTVDELPDAAAVIVAVSNPEQASALVGTSWEVGPSAQASCIDLGLTTAPRHNFVLGGDVPFYFSNHSAVADLAPDGMWHAAVVEYLTSEGEPDTDGLDAFAAFAGVAKNDIAVRRRLHRMTTVGAIATADAGGYAGRPSTTDTGMANVMIAGDWVGATGHLADASLASGRDAARAALSHLASRQVVR